MMITRKLKLAFAGALAAGLLAAAAVSAGAASVPPAPSEPQLDAQAAGCTEVVTNTRLLRVTRDSFGYVDHKLWEHTIVDRCPDGRGGTVDRNERRTQFWEDWQTTVRPGVGD